MSGFYSSRLCWLAAAFFTSVAPASALAQGAAFTLPGGASSLQETYQDWSLACHSTPQPVCAIYQQQTQQNGQSLLAVELRKNDGTLAGSLILPFGLLFDAGATLQIDNEQPRKPLRFHTCLPGGCLVPLSFDAETIKALRTGTALRVKVQSPDKKELALSISLKGLAAALDRLLVLGKT